VQDAIQFEYFQLKANFDRRQFVKVALTSKRYTNQFMLHLSRTAKKMAFRFQGQLSKFWAEIECQINSKGRTRFGHLAEIRERQLIGLQIHETGMPGSGCWWRSAHAALLPPTSNLNFAFLVASQPHAPGVGIGPCDRALG
jgi:hypothetical protein